MSSSNASSPIVVVTGANRGLGLEFVKQILGGKHKALDAIAADCIVVATARNPESATELNSLKDAYPRRLEVVKLDVEDSKDITAFADRINSSYGRVDVLINNAGIAADDEQPSTFTRDLATKSFVVNTFSPIELTAALLPSLRAAIKIRTQENNDKPQDRSKPFVRAVFVSTSMASLAETSSGGCPSYRASKAALNMYVRAFSFDVPEIAFLILHPGWVATDMGSKFGRPPLSTEESIAGSIEQIGKLTLDKSAAGIVKYDGSVLPW